MCPPWRPQSTIGAPSSPKPAVPPPVLPRCRSSPSSIGLSARLGEFTIVLSFFRAASRPQNHRLSPELVTSELRRCLSSPLGPIAPQPSLSVLVSSRVSHRSDHPPHVYYVYAMWMPACHRAQTLDPIPVVLVHHAPSHCHMVPPVSSCFVDPVCRGP